MIGYQKIGPSQSGDLLTQGRTKAHLGARRDVAVGRDVALRPREARHHAVVPEHDLAI